MHISESWIYHLREIIYNISITHFNTTFLKQSNFALMLLLLFIRQYYYALVSLTPIKKKLTTRKNVNLYDRPLNLLFSSLYFIFWFLNFLKYLFHFINFYKELPLIIVVRILLTLLIKWWSNFQYLNDYTLRFIILIITNKSSNLFYKSPTQKHNQRT